MKYFIARSHLSREMIFGNNTSRVKNCYFSYKSVISTGKECSYTYRPRCIVCLKNDSFVHETRTKNIVVQNCLVARNCLFSSFFFLSDKYLPSPPPSPPASYIARRISSYFTYNIIRNITFILCIITLRIITFYV